MHDQEITVLFRELAEAEDILSKSSVFAVQEDGVVFPLRSVDLERVDGALEQKYSARVGFMPIYMERVELNVDSKTLANFRDRPEQYMQIRNAIAQRYNAEMKLALLYGITVHGGIPHARRYRERIEPSFPDHSGIPVAGYDLVDFGAAWRTAEDPPERQDPQNS